MKKNLLFIILPLLMLVLANCRGTFAPPGGDEEKPGPAAKETSDKYEPLGQSEDFAIVSKAVSFDPVADSTKNLDGKNPTKIVDGGIDDLSGDRVYRIQLFTAKEYGPAIREKKVAIEVFDKPVTMDYEVPYYKIRVGNFLTREEAEEYLPAAREAGYKTAWVVRAYVNVKTVEDVYDGYDEEIFKPFDSTELIDMENETEQDSIEYQEN